MGWNGMSLDGIGLDRIKDMIKDRIYDMIG